MSSTGTGPARVLQFHRAAARTKAVAIIESNDHSADIFHNPEIHPPTWHYIITRRDSSEILYWGQERSLEAAEKAARCLLRFTAVDVSLG